MRTARWLGAATVALVLAGACGRDDTTGGVDGDQEGAVPAGAIPAPNQGGVDNVVAPAVPLDSAAPADTAAPLTSGAAAPDTAQ